MTKPRDAAAGLAGEKFENLLEKLRGIVRSLDSGDVPLEESLTQSEAGMSLARACQERLSQAERKIELLVKADKDGVVTEPFVVD